MAGWESKNLDRQQNLIVHIMLSVYLNLILAWIVDGMIPDTLGQLTMLVRLLWLSIFYLFEYDMNVLRWTIPKSVSLSLFLVSINWKEKERVWKSER